MEENKQTCFDENEYQGIKRGQAVKDTIAKVKNNALVKGCGDVVSSTLSGYKVVGTTFFANFFSWIEVMLVVITWPVRWAMYTTLFIPTGIRRTYDFDCNDSDYRSSNLNTFSKVLTCVFRDSHTKNDDVPMIVFIVSSFFILLGLLFPVFILLPLLHSFAVLGGIVLFNLTSLAYEIGRFEKRDASSDKNEVA